MKIEKSQLKTLLHNALVWEEDKRGGLCPNRFTPEQMRVLAKNNAWHLRAQASAGSSVEMNTDSETLALKFQLSPASSQNWASFDLYVDGVFYDTCLLPDMSSTVIGFDLPKGTHRVTIYFPWTARISVEELHLSEGASWTAVQKKGRIIAFGDSITQGYITEFPSMTYPSQAARLLNVEMLNQGVGGYRFDADSVCMSLKEYSPDALIVAYGTNDYSVYDSSEEFAQKAHDYFSKLWSVFPETPTLVIAPVYRNDQRHIARQKYRSYTLDDARDILLQLCDSRKKTVFLRESGIPHIHAVFSDDWLHPNALGFSFIAGAVAKALSSMLDIT